MKHFFSTKIRDKIIFVSTVGKSLRQSAGKAVFRQ